MVSFFPDARFSLSSDKSLSEPFFLRSRRFLWFGLALCAGLDRMLFPLRDADDRAEDSVLSPVTDSAMVDEEVAQLGATVTALPHRYAWERAQRTAALPPAAVRSSTAPRLDSSVPCRSHVQQDHARGNERRGGSRGNNARQRDGTRALTAQLLRGFVAASAKRPGPQSISWGL